MTMPIPSWLRIKAHAEERIEHCRTVLETASPEMLPAVQAEARVWRQVIALPETLSEEQIAPSGAGYT